MIGSALRVIKALGKPKIVAIEGINGLTPKQVQQLEAQVIDWRLHGRAQDSFAEQVRSQLLASGHEAPRIIEDAATDTTVVPASSEGLLVHVASWDSLLLDEELAALKNVVGAMIPMGLDQQNVVRKQRADRDEFDAHKKEHHPEAYAAEQGIPV